MSHLFPTYQRWEIEPESASGSIIIDKRGKSYLDFTSGIGVCNLGHCPHVVEEAVNKQIKQYWHVSNLFASSSQEAAAKILAEASGMDLVFFANSGAEANEGAIKLARKATGRTKIITFLNSFHGRTFATMSATGQEKIKNGYGPMLETFVYVPFNDLEALKKEMGTDVAAVMIEVIQGEGGINIGEQEFLMSVQELCKSHGSLLIIDEIQTGIGRTGKPFAFQHFNLNPDIITSAKGLGSGFPIGAVIGKKELEQYFSPGSHGSTFGGNPVSIAAATATMLTIFNQEFLAEVNVKGEYLLELIQKKLGHLPMITEIRGLGLMIGIECNGPIATYIAQLRSVGLIVLPAGERVIRLLPALTVTKEEIETCVKMLATFMGKESNTASAKA